MIVKLWHSHTHIRWQRQKKKAGIAHLARLPASKSGSFGQIPKLEFVKYTPWNLRKMAALSHNSRRPNQFQASVLETFFMIPVMIDRITRWSAKLVLVANFSHLQWGAVMWIFGALGSGTLKIHFHRDMHFCKNWWVFGCKWQIIIIILFFCKKKNDKHSDIEKNAEM